MKLVERIVLLAQAVAADIKLLWSALDGKQPTLPAGTNGQVLKHNGTDWAAGSDINTTYSAMSVAEAATGTATTSRVMRADYLKQIVPALVPAASATVQGKAKLGHDTVQTVAPAANPTTTASRSYWVQRNADGKMVVNVPWTAYSAMSSAEARAGTATSNRTLNAQRVAESARYHGQRGIFSLIDTDSVDVEGYPNWSRLSAPSGLVNTLNFSDLSNVSHHNCTFASGVATLGAYGYFQISLNSFVNSDYTYIAEWEQQGEINNSVSAAPVTMQGTIGNSESGYQLNFQGAGTVSNLRLYRSDNLSPWSYPQEAPLIRNIHGSVGFSPFDYDEYWGPTRFTVASNQGGPFVEINSSSNVGIHANSSLRLRYSNIDLSYAGIEAQGGYLSWNNSRFSLPANTSKFSSLRTIASKSAAGQVGDMCADANYLYVCVANNTWKRVALSTW